MDDIERLHKRIRHVRHRRSWQTTWRVSQWGTTTIAPRIILHLSLVIIALGGMMMTHVSRPTAAMTEPSPSMLRTRGEIAGQPVTVAPPHVFAMADDGTTEDSMTAAYTTSRWGTWGTIAMVIGDGVVGRQAPEVTAVELVVLPAGMIVPIRARTGEWAAIDVDRVRVWVHRDALMEEGQMTMTHPPTPDPIEQVPSDSEASCGYGGTRGTPTRIRAHPDITAPVLDVVPQATLVHCLHQHGAWRLVRLDTGVTGWVAADMIAWAEHAPDRPVSPSSPPPDPIQQVIDTVLALQGVPYRWGGNEPATGLDCSGLVVYGYATIGVHLPRTAEWQFLSLPRVHPRDIRLGDLIFFADTDDRGGITHVGIVLSPTHMIHAAWPSGVRIDSFTKPYWQRHLAGFRRVVPPKGQE